MIHGTFGVRIQSDNNPPNIKAAAGLPDVCVATGKTFPGMKRTLYKWDRHWTAPGTIFKYSGPAVILLFKRHEGRVALA